MAYKLKYIKNPPTADDLIALYESDLYESLFSEWYERLGGKLKIEEEYDKQLIRQTIKRNFLILNIPLDDVLSELKNFRTEFLNFCKERKLFYDSYVDEHPDGEFAEGEELADGDESEVVEEGGIVKPFLLSNFCEFYLLKNGDKERTLHYLKTTRMPYARMHLSEINKIYKKSIG